jgi:ABC-2 type transport system permease protein
MFVMFIVIIGGMGTILDDKKNNTWGRLGISPTSYIQIMAGKILGTFIKGWAQIIILILFGKFVLGVDWGNSLGATIIVFSIYLLSITGIGMFLATLVKTDAQLGPLATIIIIPTSMLSGCYWPIEIMSETMQKIAVLFPQYWAMKALRSTVIANMSLNDTAIPLIIMGAIGIAFFILSTMSGAFKHEPKQKSGKEPNIVA